APFTFEAWIYTSSTGQQTIMMTGSSSSDTLNMFYLSGQLCLYDDNTNLTTAGGAISQNTWTHVAAVRNNGKIKTYINGVQGADVAYATDTAHTIMRIGGHINGSNWFQGNISDARITKSSRYPFVPLKETLTTSTSFQSGITLTASNTKLLTAHAASITDGSATGHTVTANGNAAVSNFAPIGGMKSVYLDGTGDYLSVSSNAEFGFGTGDFTIECWFYNSAANYDNYPNIFAQVTEGSTNFRLFIFSNKFRWRAANTNAMDGTTTLEVKKWYHVALVRKSGTTRIFLNGSVEGNTYSDSVNYSADAIHIGKRGSSDGYYLTGYISNFRIVKGQAIYDKDFTPPAIALAG
ncbi:MAG: LamG domain-containing protein, partial [Rickettsiales bacterium TMED254]